MIEMNHGVGHAAVQYGGFPKLGGTLLGVPIIRTIVFWGSILGSPYFGKLPYGHSLCILSQGSHISMWAAMASNLLE